MTIYVGRAEGPDAFTQVFLSLMFSDSF